MYFNKIFYIILQDTSLILDCNTFCESWLGRFTRDQYFGMKDNFKNQKKLISQFLFNIIKGHLYVGKQQQNWPHCNEVLGPIARNIFDPLDIISRPFPYHSIFLCLCVLVRFFIQKFVLLSEKNFRFFNFLILS